MKKTQIQPSTALFPMPVLLVSSGNNDVRDIITISWTGIINSIPPMLSISIRKSRFSYDIIKKNKEFVAHLMDAKHLDIVKYCGSHSGRDVDKFDILNLETTPGSKTNCLMIDQSLIQLECKVIDIKELGSHDVFTAEIVAVHLDHSLLNEKGVLNVDQGSFISYASGKYFHIGKKIE